MKQLLLCQQLTVSQIGLFNPGVPNLGDMSPWGEARSLKLVISWVHLYQWGDAIVARGDAIVARHKKVRNP
jgi:hypothetical protein